MLSLPSLRWPCFSGLVALFFGLFLAPSALPQDQPQPNFLFILADDLGYGDLGCYGAPDIQTPHLDQLAAEGIRFTDFYSNGAVCSPTRIAFLTGRYHQRSGMENALYYQETGRGLPIGPSTIGHRLQEAGYATGLSGKWHVGYDLERQPLSQGFDHFFGLLGGNHHYFQHMDRIGVPDLWQGAEPVEREGYTTDLITEDAVTFLEENRDRPFFLYLSHAAPHFPWQGPNDAEKPVEPKKKSWQTGDRATYIAMVERMDEGIGRVLEILEELDLAEHTLVVFTSDNGGHTHSRNAPLNGDKSTLWEGGIRVPCLVRWPARLSAGVVSSQVGITMDWHATFLSAAGIEGTDPALEGIDLLPLLSEGAAKKKRTLFWRTRPGPVRRKVPLSRAARVGDWKYFERPDDLGPALFDLASDPGESRNLIGTHPDLAERLSQQLDRWEDDLSRTSVR